MSRITRIVAIAVGTFLISASAAFAGVWTPNEINNVSEVYLGPVVVASDLGAAPVAGNTVTDGTNTLVFPDDTLGYFAGPDDAATTPSLGDPGLNDLLRTGRFSNTSANIPVIPGRQYVLQMLLYERSGALNPARSMSLIAEGDSTGTFIITNLAPNTFALIYDYAFTAGDNMLNVTSNTVVDNAMINGFSLRDVTPIPEPSSLTLIAMGAALVLWKRRKVTRLAARKTN